MGLVNWLGEMLEDIPVVGNTLQWVDDLAYKTGGFTGLSGEYSIPGLLGITGDKPFGLEKDQWKDATHTIGLIAATYGLSSFLAGPATGAEAGAGALAAGEAGGAGGTAVGSLASGEAGAAVTAEQAAAAAYAGEAGGAGGTSIGSITATASEEALKNWALNQLENQAMKQALAEVGKGSSASTTGGSSSTRAIPRQSLSSEELNKIMGEALGPDNSSASFDSKGVTLKAGEGSALYKRFLGGEGSLVKSNPSLTSMKGKGDLAFKTSTKIPSSNQAELQDTDSEFSGMRNVSLASPFYQPSA